MVGFEGQVFFFFNTYTVIKKLIREKKITKSRIQTLERDRFRSSDPTCQLSGFNWIWASLIGFCDIVANFIVDCLARMGYSVASSNSWTGRLTLAIFFLQVVVVFVYFSAKKKKQL